jgi:diphthamide biosynthesis protein 2
VLYAAAVIAGFVYGSICAADVSLLVLACHGMQQQNEAPHMHLAPLKCTLHVFIPHAYTECRAVLSKHFTCCCGQAGKKTYTLLMGKPNPAKLANFPEIEVFVMLADPQGLILDSKEYLSPIITPHEAYLAFTGKAFDAAAYRLDFGDLLAGDSQQQGLQDSSRAAAVPGASVGGNVSGLQSDSEDAEEETKDGEGAAGWGAAAGTLVIAGSSQPGKVLAGTGSRSGQQVQVHSAAQYLQQHRTYKGLETPAAGGEILAAEVAVPGRSGRAAAYSDEPTAL